MSIRKVKTKNHDEWLRLRGQYIGGSDAAAVVGMNPFSSPYALWAEKTGKKPGFSGNLATEVGVTVSSNDSLDDIVDNISKEIQVMLNSGDQSKISSAQSYQAQLASISGRAEAIQSTQQNIFNAMDMISVSNKYALGL